MAYGTIKVDQITFTNSGVDQTITVSGIVESISGNITATGTIQAQTIIGTSTVSGATVTGVAGQFTTATITSGVFASGTAAAPSVSVGTTSNGIYSPGTNQLALSTNGTGRLFVDASGRVGVGAAPGSVAFDVTQPGTSSAIIRAKNDATSVYLDANNGYSYLNTFSNHPFLIGTNNTERLRITSAGLVGIGTSAPSSLLHLAAGGIHDIKLQRTGAAPSTNRIANESDLLVLENNTQGISLKTGTTPTERIRITGTGNVGIGTTSPAALCHLASSSAALVLDQTTGTSTHSQAWLVRDSNDFQIQTRTSTSSFVSIDYGSAGGASGATNHRWSIAGSERCRLDSSGRLLVGTSTSIASQFSGEAKLQVIGTGIYNLSTFQYSNDTFGNVVVIGKSRGTSPGSHAVVQAGDNIGTLRFEASDGTGFLQAASISVNVDGTPGTNDMPGRIVLSTTPDGSTLPVERMRITNDGDVWIGTIAATPGYGNTSTGFGVDNSSKTLNLSASDNEALRLNRNSDGSIVAFRQSGSISPVGTISVTTTATAYNTSSDYRLKENVTPVTDGITRLQQLKPSRFNFIADPTKTVDGFLAHEVQAIVPEAITGEKDAVDDEGNPQYQGIDQSKMVPLVVAALQECIKKVEALEAEVASLKAGA